MDARNDKDGPVQKEDAAGGYIIFSRENEDQESDHVRGNNTGDQIDHTPLAQPSGGHELPNTNG